MDGGIEAGADIVTGGLVARAVEPRTGDAGHHAHGAGHCLNCGAKLVGPHCHVCGQSAHVHRTAGAIWHDIAHGVFHFEGKAWRTLPMLAWRPGELTRRYIDGERARFVSPMALFLFSVFLMFTIVANLPAWHFGDADMWKPGVTAGMANARVELAKAKAAAKVELDTANASLAKERAKPAPDTERIVRLEKRIARSTKQRDEVTQAERLLPLPTMLDVEGAPLSTSENWIERKFREAKANPKLVLYKVKTSAYKFSWALIPLSLPFVWLLFPFSRRFGLYDHAVFATYSLTFMSLLTITLAVLGAIGVSAGALWTAATIIPPLHIYKQLKGTYQLGRISALFRTSILLLLIASGIIPLFAMLLAYLGVAD